MCELSEVGASVVSFNPLKTKHIYFMYKDPVRTVQ
jgi:hypothetical protein